MLVRINTRFVHSGAIPNKGIAEFAGAASRGSSLASRAPIYRYARDLRTATTDISSSLVGAVSAQWGSRI